MKVLILHQHFNTPREGGAIRSYYLAKALVDKGIHVTVVTGANAKSVRRELIEGIEVHYLPVIYSNSLGFFDRILSFIKYILGVVGHPETFKDVNICYVISTPLTTGLAGMWIKLRYKIPYIFEVGDLWPDAPIQLGFIKNYFLKKILYRLEKMIYEHADSIVALSPTIRSDIQKKIPNKKISIITNMADVDFYRYETKQAYLLKRYNIDKNFVISYIGTFGFANGLEYFLECAKACEHENLSVQFLLCGDGAMLQNLKHDAKRLGLSNLSILDFQNRNGVREIMNISDAIFVCYKHIKILETGSPNKYFDGLASGKLIIVNFHGWIKDEIISTPCGVFVDPENPQEITNSITPFLKNSGLLHQFQKNARQLAEQKYSRKIQGDELISLMAESR